MLETKRILVVSFQPLPSSSGQARRLCQALAAVGPRFSVDALTAKGEGEPHIERFAGARLMRVPMQGDLTARAQTFERALRRQLSGEEYDLVILGDAFGAPPILARRKQNPFGLILDACELQQQMVPLVHHELDVQPRFRHRLLRFERHTLAVADLVVVGSEAQERHLLGLGVAAEKLRRIPPSVDLDMQPTSEPPPGTFVVAALGRGAPWEGFETALRAVAQVRAQGVDARLSCAGPLPPGQRQRLRAVAEELDIGDGLELRGEIPESRVPEFLAAASVSLCLVRLPPSSVGLPLGSHRLLEGLAAGRPVIAADTPIFRELAGSAAIFMREESSNELARALLMLSRERDRAAELGRLGHQRAQAHEASSARKTWLSLVGLLLDPAGVGIQEPSHGSGQQRELETFTLSIEPTHRAQIKETEDTNPEPSAPEEPTSVGPAARSLGAGWFRAHLPSEDTPAG